MENNHCEISEVSNEDKIRAYKINRAKEYLVENPPHGDGEPRLEYCIISDLLQIVKQSQ